MNKLIIRYVVFLCFSLMLLFVSVLIYSCKDLNIYSWQQLSAEDTIKGSIDDFIFSLYRVDVIKSLENDTLRNEIIEKLEDRILNTEKEEEIKYLMALIAVLAKGSNFKKVVDTNTTSLMLELAENSTNDPNNFLKTLFKGIDRVYIPSILSNAVIIHTLIEVLGYKIQSNNNHFPDNYDIISSDYAIQAIIAGSLSIILDKVYLTTPIDTTGKTQDEIDSETQAAKITRLERFIVGEETAYIFLDPVELLNDPSKVTEINLGNELLLDENNNPSGTNLVLIAAGLKQFVDTILKN